MFHYVSNHFKHLKKIFVSSMYYFSNISFGINKLLFPDKHVIKNLCKFYKIIWIEIGTMINSSEALFQKFNIFMYQTFYSDVQNFSKFNDNFTFTFWISLYEHIFSFYFCKITWIMTTNIFFENDEINTSGTRCECTHPRGPSTRTVSFFLHNLAIWHFDM